MINEIEVRKSFVRCTHNEYGVSVWFPVEITANDQRKKYNVLILTPEETLDLISMLECHYQEVKTNYENAYRSDF